MKEVEKFLEQLEIIVNVTGISREEKRKAILEAASEKDQINIEEFCSWFAELSE